MQCFVYSRLSNFSLIRRLSPLLVYLPANLDTCLALMAFSSGSSFSCHTYYDTGRWFIWSHLKDRHPRPRVGFEPGTQGSPDLCASALTTAPRGHLSKGCKCILFISCLIIWAYKNCYWTYTYKLKGFGFIKKHSMVKVWITAGGHICLI
jgi:hypothetical protein